MNRILPRLQYFEFRHQSSSRQISRPLSNFLQVVFKFTLLDGTNLAGDPINNILHALFTEIDVSLIGKSSSQVRTHTLEKLLSYRPKTLETQMRACTLWEKHTTGHITEAGVAATEIEEVVLNVRAGGNGSADTVTIWGA